MKSSEPRCTWHLLTTKQTVGPATLIEVIGAIVKTGLHPEMEFAILGVQMRHFAIFDVTSVSHDLAVFTG